jgi:hypothetical protein
MICPRDTNDFVGLIKKASAVPRAVPRTGRDVLRRFFAVPPSIRSELLFYLSHTNTTSRQMPFPGIISGKGSYLNGLDGLVERFALLSRELDRLALLDNPRDLSHFRYTFCTGNSS